MSAVVFLLVIAGALIYLLIFSGSGRKTPPKEPPRTIRCPSCGAQAQVHGDMWECGFCGDCGMMKK